MENQMIYAAVLLLGFVLGVAAVFGYLNIPDENEKAYNAMMQERSRLKG